MQIRSQRLLIPVAIAGTLAFAGCQVGTPVTPTDTEKTIKAGVEGEAAAGAPAEAAPQRPAPAPNATITGRVVDLAGSPVAGVEVMAFAGLHTTTDAAGKFTLEVVADDALRLDFTKAGYVERQVEAALPPGQARDVFVTMKPMDPKVNHIRASEGGVATNADGSAVMIFPPGALAEDADVVLTWLRPAPSEAFPFIHGELPGRLVTKALGADGQEESGQLPPIAFTNVNFKRGRLAPGSQAELRMKIDPAILARSYFKSLDFNNPASLQQPCYDFDPATGRWVNPATSRIEKDADGTHWFVYTFRGAEQPKNFKLLSHIVDWEPTTVWRSSSGTFGESWNPGGGNWQICNDPDGCYESWTEDGPDEAVYGDHQSGTVTESSSNPSYDGNGLGGATVYHSTAFNGSSSTSTDSSGGYRISLALDQGSVGISSCSWGGASASGDGPINTDGSVSWSITGGHVNYSASNSNLSSGTWSGSGSATASRDSSISISAPSDGFFHKVGSTSASIGVRGSASFSATVGRWREGSVKEDSLNPNLDGKGLSGASVSHGADLDQATGKSTDGSGAFKIPTFYDSDVTVSGATWKGASASGGGYQMTINTDGKVKANIVGGSLAMTASNSNLSSGSWSGSVSQAASRDSSISLARPASPLYLEGSPTLSGTVPVKGLLDFGTIRILKDYSGQVLERVDGPDNLNNNRPNDRDGLAGATITGFSDTVSGATSTQTDGSGRFGFTLLGNASVPTVTANFMGLTAGSGSAPYAMEINTDASYTLQMVGVYGSTNVGQTLTVRYRVDGVAYSKSVTAASDGRITLSFARDPQDNQLNFSLESISGPDIVSYGTLPTGTLQPGGSGRGDVEMRFVSGSAK